MSAVHKAVNVVAVLGGFIIAHDGADSWFAMLALGACAGHIAWEINDR